MNSTSDLFWSDVEAAAIRVTSIPTDGADDMTFHGSLDLGYTPPPASAAAPAAAPAFDMKMLVLIVLGGILLNALLTGD
jgi:hypothetical protein